MNLYEKTYIKVSSLFPQNIVRNYEQLLVTADLKINPRIYIGFTLLLSFTVGIVSMIFMLSIALESIYAVPGGALVFVVLMAFFYYRIALLADARAQQIEKYLPEALQLISANIRAGMTVDKALWLCARPEFGPFEKELRKMAAQTLGGKPVAEALMESAKRIRSVTLDRAYRLLVQGIQLGGALANLLTEIAADIRTSQALRKEITAATTMYTIFIIFASVMAAPMLFAVSSFYVQATSKIWASQSQETTTQFVGQSQSTEMNVFKVSPESALTYDEVRLFALVCIIITTFFGSLTIGLIKNGEAKRGIKYVPLFMSAALAVYFIGYTVISSAFGQILG